MVSPTSADGSPNYSYFAAKGAVAIGLGMVAKRVISPDMARKMTEGSLIVTLHDAAKTMIPGSVSLGWASPAMIASRGNIRQIGEYVRNKSNVGEYLRRT
jgi:hypothetical protein